MSRRGKETGESTRWNLGAVAKEAVRLRREAAAVFANGRTIVDSQEGGIRLAYDLGCRSRMTPGQTRVDVDTAQRVLAEINAYQLDTAEVIGRADALRELAVRRVARDVEVLENAPVYLATPAVHATVNAAASTLEREDLRLWRQEDLPSPQGILFFPAIQHLVQPGQSVPEELIAVSWRVGQQLMLTPLGASRVVSAVFVTCWVDRHGPIHAADYRSLDEAAARHGERMPRLHPFMYAFSELDSTQSTVEFVGMEVVGEHRSPISDEAVGDFTEGEVITGTDLPTWALHHVMAYSRLVAQKIVRPEEFADIVAAQTGSKRARREHHSVRVVRLQGYAEQTAKGADAQQAGARYSHRFPVRMHRVRQWYPSEQRHQVKFRGPYIKGPKDAPLRIRDTVQALTR